MQAQLAADTTVDSSDSAAISDKDRDALHILPLSILPLVHPALRRARMIKSTQLESMVEFFALPGCGSGQVHVRYIAKMLNCAGGNQHPDMELLREIELLPSFDVYSLRILFRSSGIVIADSSALALSKAKVASLSPYMANFTKPLIAEIFGDTISDSSYTGILDLFRRGSAGEVRGRLEKTAARLGIGILDIPEFLENYADVFMSLSYYRQCLDGLLPSIQGFLESSRDIRSNYQLSRDNSLMETVALTETTINEMTADVSGRIESFERGTQDMWNDMTVERFRRIEAAIKGYQVNIASVLCALSVKMAAWTRLFPNASGAGPVRRAEFIMSEMRQGINCIRELRGAAPMLSEAET
jgi:hypothetical protein